MDAVILSIGTELTLGQTVDTNSAWLSGRLAEIGARTLVHVTLPDEIEPVAREIDRACALADAVLITGGIGPTEDDLTRQALARVLGVELTLREPLVERIRSFFTQRGRDMPEANLVQAMLPEGSDPIENTCGTAPGIRAAWKRAAVFVMPGVPREMQVMFDRDVLAVLSARAAGAVILARTLWCYGAGESDIGEAIRDLMARGRNPTVGTTAQQTVIGVRIHAQAESRGTAQHMLDATAAEVRRRLGDLVFGEAADTLADAVARLLIGHGATVSTAESCTGGLIAKSLTDVPGSSAYFLDGVVTYSNPAKTRLLGVPAELIATHGAVSGPVAEWMAVQCRLRSGSTHALSVTGIAGPTGGSDAKPVGLVHIGLAGPAGCEVTEHRLGTFLTRDEVRDRACKVALNRLRLTLL